MLSHGVENEAENARLLAALEARALAIRGRLPFRRVAVETLREDWPAKRRAAERRLRAVVSRAAAEGGRAIVIPFRFHGFGPYEQVLAGLDYMADGRGLIPHRGVQHWMRRQIAELQRACFQRPLPHALAETR